MSSLLPPDPRRCQGSRGMRRAGVTLDENRVTRAAACRETLLAISFLMPWNVKALAGITPITKKAVEGADDAGTRLFH
jgi:hypothetical protein